MPILDVKSILRNLFIAQINRRLAARSSNMLFIIGHMRSGSTLLTHILANHPEILGYGETQHVYQSTKDFGLIAYSILRKFRRLIPRERYYFDKVLHDDKHVTHKLLTYNDTRVILLARRPDRALKSILSLGLKKTETEEKALQYYTDRLTTIKNLATVLGKYRCHFITYDDLTDNPAKALQSLSSFLELSTPLSEEYKLLWSTGKAGIGDSSESIAAGRIAPSTKPLLVNISDDTLAQAEEHYQACIKQCTFLS